MVQWAWNSVGAVKERMCQTFALVGAGVSGFGPGSPGAAAEAAAGAYIERTTGVIPGRERTSDDNQDGVPDGCCIKVFEKMCSR